MINVKTNKKMKNNKVTVEEVLKEMAGINTLLLKISQLLDKTEDKMIVLTKLRSSIEDFEPFINDERVELVSNKIIELLEEIRLKCNNYI